MQNQIICRLLQICKSRCLGVSTPSDSAARICISIKAQARWASTQLALPEAAISLAPLAGAVANRRASKREIFVQADKMEHIYCRQSVNLCQCSVILSVMMCCTPISTRCYYCQRGRTALTRACASQLKPLNWTAVAGPCCRFLNTPKAKGNEHSIVNLVHA